MEAGEDLERGDAVYLGKDGKVYKKEKTKTTFLPGEYRLEIPKGIGIETEKTIMEKVFYGPFWYRGTFQEAKDLEEAVRNSEPWGIILLGDASEKKEVKEEDSHCHLT